MNSEYSLIVDAQTCVIELVVKTEKSFYFLLFWKLFLHRLNTCSLTVHYRFLIWVKFVWFQTISSRFCAIHLSFLHSGIARAFQGGRLAHPEGQNEDKNVESLMKNKKKWEKFEEIWGKWNFCPPGTVRLTMPLFLQSLKLELSNEQKISFNVRNMLNRITKKIRNKIYQRKLEIGDQIEPNIPKLVHIHTKQNYTVRCMLVTLSQSKLNCFTLPVNGWKFFFFNEID